MRVGAPLVVMLVACVGFVSSAWADELIADRGEGAAKTNDPYGLAVDLQNGRLYVADQGNNRVDVFGADGHFEGAFGWAVNKQNPEAKLQFCTLATGCQKGSVGAGKGQFDQPTNIAVDNSGGPSQGDIYVVDYNNLRIEKFDPTAGVGGTGVEFLLTFGGGVNKTTGGNVCTAASGDTCGAGSDGFKEGEFAVENLNFLGKPILVGVGPGGVVYVVDNRVEQEVGIRFDLKYRLQRFEPSGSEIAPQHLLHEGSIARAMAVDPSSGEFYIANDLGGPAEEQIRKFSPTGTPLGQPIPEFGWSLALDLDGDLFVAARTEGGADPEDERESIVEYDSSGAPQRRFAYWQAKTSRGTYGPFQVRQIPGLAVDKDGLGLYAAEAAGGFGEGLGSRVLHIDLPAPGPIVLPEPCQVAAGTLGNTRATLRALVNPESEPTSFRFEYVDQQSFDAEGGFASPATQSTASSAIGEDTVLHDTSQYPAAKVEGLAPETVYHCRVVAVDSEGHEAIGLPGTFETKEGFEFGSAWAAAVGETSATLKAEGNPLGIPATVQFEYVDDAKYQESGFAGATVAPETEIQFPAAETMQLATATLSNLSPGVLYHYRLRAKNAFAPQGIVCPEQKSSCPAFEHTFRTYLPEPGTLPDGRGYELVSPNEKNSAEVGVPGVAGGLTTFPVYSRIQASSGSGEAPAITFTSVTSFGQPQGAPATSQYLARRGQGAWEVENISPFGANRGVIPIYRGFTPDLGRAGLVVGQTTESEEEVPGLYLRDDQTGGVALITAEEPKVPEGMGELCLDYAGVSADGTRAFFSANFSYAGAPEGSGAKSHETSLYEWSAGEGLRPLSILPGKSVAAAPTEGTGFGSGEGHCQSGEALTRHVVSDDGTRVFWTYAPATPGSATQLLVRLDGKETVQIDKRVSGTGSSGNGVFRGASADGSKVFFTDKNKLMTGAREGDLYLFELPDKTLVDLTQGPEPAGVRGVVGISDDGSYAYFVATGVLSGDEQNGAGEKAQAGENNLYVYHEGEVGFVAVLSDEDNENWSQSPHHLSARVSADGRHLAFLSVEAEALADYDNTVQNGSHCRLSTGLPVTLEGPPSCPEAFLYSAESKELVCASCNPAGTRPQGPAVLPAWSNPFEGPRYLSADGSRLFFESFDALLPGDENDRRDVYEFERPGKGSCTAENPNYDPSAEGCLFLMSGGKGSDETYLLDASSEGRDVFLSTRDRLVGWADRNENYDVYDFREGGGFPEPPVLIPCEDESSCKPPLPVAPPAPAPATSGLSGSGNAQPRHHKKHRKKHHKKRRSHHRHHHKKGAGR